MTIEIDGLNINYAIKGDGDYVFLLHGWGANHQLFSPLADGISSRYTVVSLDLPGFGDSDEPGCVWDVSAYARFMVRFIGHFPCDRVILLGHSFGGRIIIKMSSMGDLPFSIDKIILVDSAGILPHRTFRQKAKVALYKCGKALFGLPPFAKLFPGAIENYKSKMGSADYRSASGTMRGVLVKTVNEDLEPLLKNIRSQTLLIWGDQDTATPLGDGVKMEKAIAGAGTDVGLVVLKGAGHYSFIDRQAAFLRVICSFLKVGT
ncbi:MAG: alpha/beta hydrolase [Lachnospiraceae bacterium]|nr:alpha/beta hydrolase [Lachnospiraceae bacterium]